MKLDTALTRSPYVYQVCFRLNCLVEYYGRETVIDELLNSSQNDIMLEIHIENIYGTFELDIIQDAIGMLFPNELEKVA